MHPTYLGKLVKGCNKVSVCVRVMRKWIFKENMGEAAPLYVGLVLADAKVGFLHLHCIFSLAYSSALG